MPVARPRRRGEDDFRPARVVRRCRGQVRSSGRQIDSRRPVGAHDRVGAQQLSIAAIEHVEEAVLGRVQHHRTLFAVDGHGGQDHRLGRGEVPVVARRFLIEPLEPSAFRVQRDDRRQIEVGASLRRPPRGVIRSAVAGSDQHQAGFRIVVDRIPRRTAAAQIPAAGRIPGLHRRLEIRVILRPQLGVAGNHVEPPGELAAVEIERADIAAHVVLGPAVADHHHIAGDFGGTGRMGPALVILDRIDLPHDLPGSGVERIEHPVERADEDFAACHRDPAIGHVATHCAVDLHVHHRLEPPQFPAAGRVEGISPPGDARRVHDPADHHRGRLEHAIGAEFRLPCQPQRGDVGGGDVGQRGMVRLAPIAAGERPVARPDSRIGGRAATGGEQQQARKQCMAEPGQIPFQGLGIR